jgi:hypothetical protein
MHACMHVSTCDAAACRHPCKQRSGKSYPSRNISLLSCAVQPRCWAAGCPGRTSGGWHRSWALSRTACATSSCTPTPSPPSTGASWSPTTTTPSARCPRKPSRGYHCCCATCMHACMHVLQHASLPPACMHVLLQDEGRSMPQCTADSQVRLPCLAVAIVQAGKVARGCRLC